MCPSSLIKMGTPAERNQIQTSTVACGSGTTFTNNAKWFCVEQLEGTAGMFTIAFLCLRSSGLFAGAQGSARTVAAVGGYAV